MVPPKGIKDAKGDRSFGVWSAGGFGAATEDNEDVQVFGLRDLNIFACVGIDLRSIGRAWESAPARHAGAWLTIIKVILIPGIGIFEHLGGMALDYRRLRHLRYRCASIGSTTLRGRPLRKRCPSGRSGGHQSPPLQTHSGRHRRLAFASRPDGLGEGPALRDGVVILRSPCRRAGTTTSSNTSIVVCDPGWGFRMVGTGHMRWPRDPETHATSPARGVSSP
jgi:hypothetical protein